MCGAYVTINNPFVGDLEEMLKASGIEDRGIRLPASSIQIIPQSETRALIDATWWLMLGPDGKANYKYSTFNSRSDKLHTSRLTKGLFKQSRCVIPATGFIEGQNKKYHLLERPQGALALGGICKTHQVNGQQIVSASIITCPGGNPQLENIHNKSIPLILDHNDTNLIDMWLSPDVADGHVFDDLLTRNVPVNLIATPIAKARDLTPIDSPKEIQADV